MADTTTQQVNLELRAIDHASAIVGNIGRVVGKLGLSLDNITRKTAGIVSRYGGIGAALSLGASVASAKRYYDQIVRIRNVAGGAANEIAGIRYAMVQAGVSAQDFENAYVTMAKKGGEMNAHMLGAQRLSRRMGVDFRQGPLDAMIKLADQVKSGKVGYKELNALLGETGLRMRSFLKQGGPIVAKAIEQARKKMGHVNEETLMQYIQLQQEVGKVKQAWQRMVVIVGTKLMPILTKMMDGLASRIDSWANSAAKFGQFLVDHMDTVVSLAKTFGKIMAANYVLMQLTGEGLTGQMGKLVRKAGAGKKTAGAGFLPGALVQGMQAGGLQGKAAGGIMKMMGKGKGGNAIGRILLMFFKGALKLLPIVKVLLKLTGIALIVTAIIHGIKMALSNVRGLKDMIVGIFKKIGRHLRDIGATFSSIFSKKSPIGKFLMYIGTAVSLAFAGLMTLVKTFMRYVSVAVGMIAAIIDRPSLAFDPKLAWKTARGEINVRRIERAGGGDIAQYQDTVFKLGAGEGALTAGQLKAAKVAIKKVNKFSDEFGMADNMKMFMKSLKGRIAATSTGPPDDRPGTIQDFRGSHFDITQKFAEGFDPDRIAAAFADDLSMFGERSVEATGTLPLGVVR